MAQYRFWVFTINNPEGLLDFEDHPNVRYCVYSEEVGEEGTLHFQGYIEFFRTVRAAAVQKVLPGAWHAPRRGTQQEAIDYATKMETQVGGPYVYGVPSKGSGERTDLENLKKALDSGASDKEISENYFAQFLKYNRGIALYRNLHAARQNRKPLVSFYYGPTGTGKTASVCSVYEDVYIRSNTTGAFWEGFNGQSVVLIDDFYGWMPYHDMLRYLDRYPLKVNVKGSSCEYAPARIVITSNRLLHDWYDKEKIPDISALVRRIDNFVYFWDASHIGSPIKSVTYSDFLAEVGISE